MIARASWFVLYQGLQSKERGRREFQEKSVKGVWLTLPRDSSAVYQATGLGWESVGLDRPVVFLLVLDSVSLSHL
jgi:hypothetical protein